MAIDIKVPSVGESITEVTLVKWLKADGSYVERDEVIAELESEKATFEINAEKAGVLKTIAREGDTIKIGDTACTIDDTVAKPEGVKTEPAPQQTQEAKPAEPVQQPAKAEEKKQEMSSVAPAPVDQNNNNTSQVKTTPVAAAMLADKKVDIKTVVPSGSNGKILKNDVLSALSAPGRSLNQELFTRDDRPEKMSNLRKTISRRLVEAKNTTAMLTTFNEVDMSAIMELRTKYKEIFKKQHNVNLGFMSFFTRVTSVILSPTEGTFISIAIVFF
jgi:2-oxoglutarate dehydrogenase E2 component (dihydrolipoamide succinyltransferase)